jgi:hypothetical protein
VKQDTKEWEDIYKMAKSRERRMRNMIQAKSIKHETE